MTNSLNIGSSSYPKGSHQIFKNRSTGRMTVVPMHKRDLPKGTLLSILKQAGIDKEELL